MRRLLTGLTCWVIFTTLLAANCQAADYLTPSNDASKFRLSNMRIEKDRFGREVIAIDYTRTHKGVLWARLEGKSVEGPITIMGFSMPDDESGTIHLSQTFGGGSPEIELFLTTPAHWAGKSYGMFLVSNPVRMGSLGPATTARAWNAEEQAAYEKNELGKVSPKSLPEGFLAVDAEMELVGGVPVKAGNYGDWVDAELISIASNLTFAVKMPDQATLKTFRGKGWLAVDPEVLKAVKTDPGSFKPSVQVALGGTLIVPDGMEIVNSETPLAVGVPLKIEYASRWTDAYAAKFTEETITIRYKGYSSTWDKEMARGKLIISKETLATLKNPDEAAKFAVNIKSTDSTRTSPGTKTDLPEGALSRSNYPIKIDIPDGAQIVPDDLELTPGTKLAGCWGSKWYYLTVLGENSDGSVNIHWDDFSDAWNGSMLRSQLIIQDKTVKTLKRKPATKNLKEELRVWTDASGKHKINAKFVRKTEDSLVLLTDAGKEVTVPLSKMSEEDQQLVAGMKDESEEVENPFEQ